MVTRAEVARAALRLFSDRGYATTSMRDLAAHIGIQAPTLYSHYRSKEELLIGALDPLLHDLDLLLDEPGDSAAQIRQWLRRYHGCLLEHREAAKLAAGDLGVGAVPALGQRLRQQNALARQRLAVAAGADEATAAAILGALWWPLVCLPLDHPIDPDGPLHVALLHIDTMN